MTYSLFHDDILDILDSLSGSRRGRDAVVNGPAGRIVHLTGACPDCLGIGLCGRDHRHNPPSTTTTTPQPKDNPQNSHSYLKRLPASFMHSLSYDEAKDYLSLIGCNPCPSAEETKREFENHLRSLPGYTSTHTTTTPQPKDNPMFDGMFNGICGRIKPGNCRLSYTGGVAIRTADGTYKTYNLKTGQLTNCDRFVFDVGDDLFMMVPTRKLKKGDIVLFGGQPKCVIEVLDESKHVKVINYNTAVIEEVVPERHVFMGRRFYGKIVSLMGNGFMKGGKGGMFKNLLKFKMMSSMLGGKADGSGIGEALPMMFMMGGGSFDGMFDFDCDGDDDKDDDDDEDTGFLGGIFDDGDGKEEAKKEEK